MPCFPWQNFRDVVFFELWHLWKHHVFKLLQIGVTVVCRSGRDTNQDHMSRLQLLVELELEVVKTLVHNHVVVIICIKKLHLCFQKLFRQVDVHCWLVKIAWNHFMLESLALDPEFFLSSELTSLINNPIGVMAGGQKLRCCELLGPLEEPITWKSFVVDFFHPSNFWTVALVEKTREISCAVI